MPDLIYNSMHLETIKKQLSETDEFTIMSPFLATLSGLNLEDYKLNLKLITQIAEDYSEPINAQRFLFIKYLADKFSQQNRRFNLYNVSDLHSKIYLFKKNGIPESAIVTSANFTDAGIGGVNEECGMFITDDETLRNLDIYINGFSEKEVNLDDLRQKIAKAETALKEITRGAGTAKRNSKTIKPEFVKNNLLQDLISNIANKTNKVWLKPLYTTDMITQKNEQELINLKESRKCDTVCHFRNEPYEIQVGDILICYIVRVRQVLFVRRVTSNPSKTAPDWQWPWSVNIEPIDAIKDLEATDKYKIDDFLPDFFSKYPNGYVDFYKNRNFKQLRRQDKLKLTTEFGISALESYINHTNSQAYL